MLPSWWYWSFCWQCLGPIAWPSLMHAQCPSKAHARLHPLYIRRSPSTSTALALQLVQHEHSNKWLYQHASYKQNIALLLFVYETWWQRWTCSSRGIRRLRPVREKEKRKAIFQCSQVASLPRRVGAARQDLCAYNWFNQGSGESRIRQRTMDTHRKTIKSLREVYFEL